MFFTLCFVALLASLTASFGSSTSAPPPPAAPPEACPYNFTPPRCEEAEPQAPRDLTTGAQGERRARSPALAAAQAWELQMTNLHYHLGAEHKSDEYNDGTASEAYDHEHHEAADGHEDLRPGWMCPITDEVTPAQLKPYEFKHCGTEHGVPEVGKSYELHFVHSSAGGAPIEVSDTDWRADPLRETFTDGLGSAANGRGLLNPMVVVMAMVVQVGLRELRGPAAGTRLAPAYHPVKCHACMRWCTCRHVCRPVRCARPIRQLRVVRRSDCQRGR